MADQPDVGGHFFYEVTINDDNDAVYPAITEIYHRGTVVDAAEWQRIGDALGRIRNTQDFGRLSEAIRRVMKRFGLQKLKINGGWEHWVD